MAGMIICHTNLEVPLGKAKVAITMDDAILGRLDRLVREQRFANRSQAIEAAVAAHLDRLDHRRLAAECARLDPADEQAMAAEGLGTDGSAWPTY